jgi:hypothetical protein
MKHCLLFGFVSALATAFVTLVLYFAGFHSDVAKLGAANWIGGLVDLAIAVTCVVLGTRAVREDNPPGEAFGYGRALWAALRTAIVAVVIGTVFSYCYLAFINPGFSDVLLQDKMQKLEASGASGAKLEQAEAMTRMFLSPGWAAIFGLVFGMLYSLVIALIVAACMKRPAEAAPAGLPPTL